ncbi:MAG: nucleotide exchange factor GrpE [Armatimonadetes bacterium]|nr:nucleotide exchange factor GrpE [Armatimonadota bacterium]
MNENGTPSASADAPVNQATADAMTPEDTTPSTEIPPVLDDRDTMIAALQMELESQKDQMLRAMAEAQTIQRRLRTQMEQDRKYAAEPLARELVVALDNFTRSIKAAEAGASAEAILDGVRSIESQIRKALESVGVKKVESVGQVFNPEVHEAIVTHETDEHPDETVLDEIEAGYIIHDRVLRPARVRVSKQPE